MICSNRYISPAACGLRWNVNFHHDLHGSHKNSPIFTTATPPRSHNQNLLLCWVGWAHPRRMNATPLVKVAIVKNEHSPSRKWRKSFPDSSCGGSLLRQVLAPLCLLCCPGHILLSAPQVEDKDMRIWTPTMLVVHLPWIPWSAGRILFHLSWLLIIRSQIHFNSSA